MNGRAGEADQRHVAQRRHQQRHRVGDGRDGVAVQGLHGGHVTGGADGVGDDRPDVRHDVQVDARRAQRDDDVGEQDGGVHAVPANRLQRDLGDQLRVEARLHHGVLCPQRPVLGQ